MDATNNVEPHFVIYYLEGNISSGKSTVIENLRILGYTVFEEPLDVWQRDYVYEGRNILELFYSDTKKWGFKFEMVSMMTRYKQLQAALDTLRNVSEDAPNVVFIERSLLTDRYTFALNLYHTGVFDELEWKIYCDWHTLFMSMVNTLTSIDGVTTSMTRDGKTEGVSTEGVSSGHVCNGNLLTKKKIVTEYIYIQTPPEECYNRKLGRARAEEDGVVPKYFHELHNKHEEWLSSGYLEGVGTTGIVREPSFPHDIYAIGVVRVHIIRGHETREQVLGQIVNIIGPNQLIKKFVSIVEK